VPLSASAPECALCAPGARDSTEAASMAKRAKQDRNRAKRLRSEKKRSTAHAFLSASMTALWRVRACHHVNVGGIENVGLFVLDRTADPIVG
jgi:hypothetical protein